MQQHLITYSNTLLCYFFYFYLSSLKAAVSQAVDPASLFEQPESLCSVDASIIHLHFSAIACRLMLQQGYPVSTPTFSSPFPQLISVLLLLFFW